MRLARSVLQNLEGTNIYAIIGIIIFFTFFIGMIIYVMKMRAKKVDEYSRIPLEDGEEEAESDNQSEKNNKK